MKGRRPLVPGLRTPVPDFEALTRALPEVEVGIACAGTALESRTYRVKGKAFLFVSREHLRLKLESSIGEARQHGAEVGTGGWTKLALDALPSGALLKRWIAESHALLGTNAPRKAGPKRKV